MIGIHIIIYFLNMQILKIIKKNVKINKTDSVEVGQGTGP